MERMLTKEKNYDSSKDLVMFAGDFNQNGALP